MLNWANRYDKCRLNRHRPSTASRRSRIDIVDSAGDRLQHARPGRANIRSRRHGEAEAPGQGVQPQPPNWLAPQRDQFGSGGAESRGEAPAEQPAPAGGRDLGGEAPAPSEARLPAMGSRAARVTREARKVRASSPQPKAKPAGARSGPGGAAPTAGSRASRGAPRARRRRALEASGAELSARGPAPGARPRSGAAAVPAGSSGKKHPWPGLFEVALVPA